MTDNTLSLLVQNPELREHIHFDTLLTDAQQVLDTHAPRNWSDREEHDPGMTLLQGMLYGVSDLAYRHTLPLPDLLTTSSSNGPFSDDFSRAAILRRDPLTEDDYRHAILNLRPEEDAEASGYYFHNVRFIPNTDERAPKYWLEGEDYRYQPTASSANFSSLSGTYTLQLELSAAYSKNKAQGAIQHFLEQQHNLCESVSAIEWIAAYPVNIVLALALSAHQEPNAARLMAHIWRLAQACVRPSARRRSIDLDDSQVDEDQFNGWQAHSDITQLPPKRDYAQPEKIDISALIRQVKSLDGVAKIERLEFEKPPTVIETAINASIWELTVASRAYAQLWGDSIAVMLDKVEMRLNGVRVSISPEAVELELAEMAATTTGDQSNISWSGRFRNPGHKIAVGERLPACYGLQQLALSNDAQQLQSFLKPFERELEKGTKQLAQLPQLLSFDQRAAASDLPKNESAWVEHLLGYFDTGASEPAVSEHDQLITRRGLLKQINQIAAARGTGVSPAHPVTSLQRRIAGRLGLGNELFTNQPDLGRLPFYVIEHSQLLPKIPTPQSLTPVKVIKASSVSQGDWYFELFVPSSSGFVAGQVIDLLINTDLGNASGITLDRVITDEANQRLEFDLNEAARFNPHLIGANLDLIKAVSEGQVNVQGSSVWLKSQAYPVKSAANSGTESIQQFTLQAQQYPFVTFKVGMPIALGYHVGKEATVWSKKGVVSVYDEETGFVTINVDNDQSILLRRLYWKPKEISTNDLFSLSVSVIFPEYILSDDKAEKTKRAALIERIVREETPAHLTSYIHWMERDEFKVLSHEYQQWATYHDSIYTAAPYLPSYLLLSRLGLGRSPGNFEGIGFMHITSAGSAEADAFTVR